MQQRIDNLKTKFAELYGSQPSAVAKGPGRVDLLGIHTDYNDGFVLPIAVNVEVIIAGKVRDDRTVRLYSGNFDSCVAFDLDDLKYDEEVKWSNYVRGVLKYIQESGRELRGADIALEGNIPVGSGLSSSAAIEMATGIIFQHLCGFEMGGAEMALIGQKAENKFVGVNTGIMDQFISRLGRKEHALFIDCRSLEYEQFPLDTSKVKIVVCDTMKRRGLVDSEYGLRRSQCEQGVEMFAQWYPNVKALRDVTMDMFNEHKNDLEDVVRMRAEHVIGENARAVASRDVLMKGGLEDFGQLMNESHDSARDLYEVSCAELEAMVEVTRSAPGSLCGRLAGAGFGGCTVSLVENDAVSEFIEYTKIEYKKKTNLDPALYACTAEDGAKVLETL